MSFQPEIAQRLVIEEDPFSSASMLFEMQPILRLDDDSIFGYELLYRGPIRRSWAKVDAVLLRYLRTTPILLPRLFVNLAHETILQTGINDFVQAAARHEIIFELSEARMSETDESLLVARINALTKLGVQFALDDFGSGQDGFQRLFALDSIRIVKIDGALLKAAATRPTSSAMLKGLVGLWREGGMQVVAEWVENAQLYRFAQELGVDMVQGYYVDTLNPRYGARRLLRRARSFWDSLV